MPNSLRTKRQPKGKTEEATFAAGCFWGVEHLLKQVRGVISTTVGYTGGHLKNPTYEQVCSGTTGHAEAVRVEYDPAIITYRELLGYFWRLHDPTQLNRQGPDIGEQYRSAIFYHSGEQRETAEKSKAEFDSSGVFRTRAVTEITPLVDFFEAEEYHQDYIEKHPERACHALRPK
jgi:peptide-methionine (S)-S-oxide reductase